MPKFVPSDLTAEQLKLLLHYDPLTGVFTRTRFSKGCKAGDIAGTQDNNPDSYINISVKGKSYGAQRLAVLYMTGEWPKGVVDHKDGNRKNNVWKNLEDKSHSDNLLGYRKPSKTLSRLRGVTWHEKAGAWVAQHMVRGEKIYLGLFDDLDIADASLKASREGKPLPPNPRQRYAYGVSRETPEDQMAKWVARKVAEISVD